MGWFIAIAVAMWILQCLLGLWQFGKFNRRFKQLRAEGRVAIGRAKGKMRAGVVVLFCIDAEANIIKAEKMQGITIFSGLEPFDLFDGISLLTIDETACAALDKNLKAAVLNAIENYRQFERQKLDERAVIIANPVVKNT
jgi:glucitol operon activator protein